MSFSFLVTANLKGLVSRGKLTQDKASKAFSLLKGVLDYTEFKDVDMVIEVWSQSYLYCSVSNSSCINVAPGIIFSGGD